MREMLDVGAGRLAAHQVATEPRDVPQQLHHLLAQVRGGDVQVLQVVSRKALEYNLRCAKYRTNISASNTIDNRATGKWRDDD